MSKLYKIAFFVPPENAQDVKNAMFSAMAGRIGNYDCCSWETLGTGQFRPLKNSNPYIGKQDYIEQVLELKVEMVCEEPHITQVINALKATHPYETPAYDVWEILTI